MVYKRKQLTKKIPKSIAKYVKKAVQKPREKRMAERFVVNTPGFHNAVNEVFQGNLLVPIGPDAGGQHGYRIGNSISLQNIQIMFDIGSMSNPSDPVKVRIILIRQNAPSLYNQANLMTNVSGDNMLDAPTAHEAVNAHVLHDKVYDLTSGSPTFKFSKLIKFHVNMKNRKVIYNDQELVGGGPQTDLRLFLIPYAINSNTGLQICSYNCQYRLNYTEA